MCAIVDKELSSEIGYRGIFKKVLIFMLVDVGHLIDTHLIGDGSVLRTAVIFFYCSNEGISMLEITDRNNGREKIAGLLKEQTCKLGISDEQLVRPIIERFAVYLNKLEIKYKLEIIVEIGL